MSKHEIKQQMDQLKESIQKYYQNKELHGVMMLKYRELKQQLNK